MIVSVALIPTFASFIPVAAQIPYLGSTFGQVVYLKECSGNSTSTCEILLTYFLGCLSFSTTFIFLTSNLPSSFLAIIVEPSLLAFLPTNIVVHGIKIPPTKHNYITY